MNKPSAYKGPSLKEAVCAASVPSSLEGQRRHAIPPRGPRAASAIERHGGGGWGDVRNGPVPVAVRAGDAEAADGGGGAGPRKHKVRVDQWFCLFVVTAVVLVVVAQRWEGAVERLINFGAYWEKHGQAEKC